jgi:hypothetical protein
VFGGPDPFDGGRVDATSPYNTPLQCTSNRMWTNGDLGSTLMHPGRTCIACHIGTPAPVLTIAGTVYPSAHEPDDCFGAAATVAITDANGRTVSLIANSSGNFLTEQSVALPFFAKVMKNGQERAMQAAQTVGDCNSCHTVDGANGAPGRIFLP